ncbi:IS3-like element ISFsp8 family transposase [Frankia sp. EAN1pec]|uniref:IS3-like element ISFsp8 family transposase n=1 Tax=Parafrankia sp. (strain EAN1pec) TaxID=298653 RepID=UPI000A2F0B45
MSQSRRRYTPEYKDEAVKLVIDSGRPTSAVAKDLGINEGTLGSWVATWRRAHQNEEEPLSMSERARLRELEKENRELRMEREFLFKSDRLLRATPSVTDKYELIAAEKDNYPVTKMCQWLVVSTSGFYDWHRRPASTRTRRHTTLDTHVRAVFAASRQTYGARRIAAALTASGLRVSVRLARRIMRRAGLEACQPRAYRRTTIPGQAPAPADHVRRDFTATRPGEKLIGDITYIRTGEGWLYLATVIDCYSRKVAGWSMATHLRTELIIDAFTMAASRTTLAPNALFHSDRGAQYTSDAYHRVLKRHGVRPSVGATGVCWDNSAAESFFGTLKNELVYRENYPTRRAARTAIAEYIEVFYNRQRLHSTLGYRTPENIERAYHSTQNEVIEAA